MKIMSNKKRIEYYQDEVAKILVQIDDINNSLRCFKSYDINAKHLRSVLTVRKNSLKKARSILFTELSCGNLVQRLRRDAWERT